MGYPVITPPVHHSVLFHRESNQQPVNERHVIALKNPPLYGISNGDYDKEHIDLGWPGVTDYQATYGTRAKPKLPDPSPASRRCPVPVPAVQELMTYSANRQRHPYKLYETTPLPLLDKKIRGCRYHVNHPMGMLTNEERTRCKLGTMGPETITWRTQVQNEFLPNYRYKEWIDRPLPELARERDSNLLTCRVPAADTRYYDFYHQVRMHRKSPKVPGDKFLTCEVIPIPRNLIGV